MSGNEAGNTKGNLEKKGKTKKEIQAERRETTKSVVIGVRELHKKTMNDIYLVLAGINRRLFEIQAALEKAQYKQHGSITLTLHRCKDEYCLGCPHPIWYKWIAQDKQGPFIKNAAAKKQKKAATGRFFATKLKNPKQSIARSKAVKDHSAVLLVIEAERLLDRRSKIVQKLSYLARYATATNV